MFGGCRCGRRNAWRWEWRSVQEAVRWRVKTISFVMIFPLPPTPELSDQGCCKKGGGGGEEGWVEFILRGPAGGGVRRRVGINLLLVLA